MSEFFEGHSRYSRAGGAASGPVVVVGVSVGSSPGAAGAVQRMDHDGLGVEVGRGVLLRASANARPSAVSSGLSRSCNCR